MAQRPNVPHGYLGQQPKFAELGLSAFSHPENEITVNDNSPFEIKLKFKEKPVKVTHQLINARTEEEQSEYVFTQTQHGLISFVISLPTSDYYKFQIFALAADDDNKSLPNVCNYLINCTAALTQAYPYPKQYAQWKEGCYLFEPLVLNKDMSLANVNWKVGIPNANAVAVVADGEWFHLDKKGKNFEGKADLNKFKGKDTKVTVNANLGPDDSKYSTLLEYRI